MGFEHYFSKQGAPPLSSNNFDDLLPKIRGGLQDSALNRFMVTIPELARESFWKLDGLLQSLAISPVLSPNSDIPLRDHIFRGGGGAFQGAVTGSGIATISTVLYVKGSEVIAVGASEGFKAAVAKAFALELTVPVPPGLILGFGLIGAVWGYYSAMNELKSQRRVKFVEVDIRHSPWNWSNIDFDFRTARIA
jgi:hypothetical protein